MCIIQLRLRINKFRPVSALCVIFSLFDGEITPAGWLVRMGRRWVSRSCHRLQVGFGGVYRCMCVESELGPVFFACETTFLFPVLRSGSRCVNFCARHKISTMGHRSWWNALDCNAECNIFFSYLLYYVDKSLDFKWAMCNCWRVDFHRYLPGTNWWPCSIRWRYYTEDMRTEGSIQG